MSARDDIRNMEEYGYNLGGLIDILETLERDSDKMFYGCIIQGADGSYREAFSVNPDNLSPIMQPPSGSHF